MSRAGRRPPGSAAASPLARALIPFGAAAQPALALYVAAEDRLPAAGTMTVLSRDQVQVLEATLPQVKPGPLYMGVLLGYAARLSIPADQHPPLPGPGLIPPFPALPGPSPTALDAAAVRSPLGSCVAALAKRFTEICAVPEPVWEGFAAAAGLRLGEELGRAGRKAAASAHALVSFGYMFRAVDEAYGLAPETR